MSSTKFKTTFSENKSNLSSRVPARPFLKWAGGKSQLLSEISVYYPFENNEKITKYAEPFVGSGAVLFDILNKFSLNEVYISDINSELINTYKAVRDNADNLIYCLYELQESFLPLSKDERKIFYLDKRDRFNEIKTETSQADKIEEAALLIFLNKTCFNGLYRVNAKGLFNVPMGSYQNPLICDEANLRAASEKLNNVEIVNCDYKKSSDFIDSNTFVYFDPPYRPISATSNFTSYSECDFNDEKQIELASFIDRMDEKGAKILLSNSDPKNADIDDDFFDSLYSNYYIKRVQATRSINSNGHARGKISELLISNF